MAGMNTLLVLSSSLFVLTIIGVGVGFLVVSENALSRTALEVGKGETTSAQEHVSQQLESFKTDIESIASEIQYMTVSHTPEAVEGFFNSTLRQRWLADISQPQPPALGYGMHAFLNTTNDTAAIQDPSKLNTSEVAFIYPQVFYDLLHDGQTAPVMGWGSDGPVDYYYVTVHSDPVTQQNSFSHPSAYAYRHNFNLTAYFMRALRAFESSAKGQWYRSQRWKSYDNHQYHYLTYYHSFVLRDSLFTSTGWLSSLDLLGDLVRAEAERNGLIFLVDGDGRVLATTNVEMNKAFEASFSTQEGSEEERVLSEFELELGIHNPNPYVRNVYIAIQDRLHFDPAGNDSHIMNAAFKQNVEGEGSTFIVIRQIANAHGLQLALVWCHESEELLRPMRAKQLLIGIPLLVFTLLIALLLGLMSYGAIVQPLKLLHQSMEALSNLRMAEVRALDTEVNAQNPRVPEVASLYNSYRWLRQTVEECLPYIPNPVLVEDEEGDLESLDSISINNSTGNLPSALFQVVAAGGGGGSPSSMGFESQTGSRNVSVPQDESIASLSISLDTHQRPNPLGTSGIMTSKQRDLGHHETVVLHIELSPEISYSKIDRLTWREVLQVLHLEGCLVAKETKGTVFSLKSTAVSIAWWKVASPARKAVEAAHQFLARAETRLRSILPLELKQISFVGCGIADGNAIIGICGTQLKKNFVCDGSPVLYARIFARLALADYAGVYCTARIANEVRMFSECRPVDHVEVPSFTTALGVMPANGMTIVQCVSMRNTEENAEWMYLLQEQENTDKGTSDTYLTALDHLRRGNIRRYRRFLGQCAPMKSLGNGEDEWLRHRRQLLCVTNNNNNLSTSRSMSRSNSPTPSPKGSLGGNRVTCAASAPPEDGLTSEIITFFESISRGERVYSRAIGVLDVQEFLSTAAITTADDSERPSSSSVPLPLTPEPHSAFGTPLGSSGASGSGYS